MELKAETVISIIQALSVEEKNRLFIIMGLMPKKKPVRKRQFNIDIEELAKIALENHRKTKAPKTNKKNTLARIHCKGVK